MQNKTLTLHGEGSWPFHNSYVSIISMAPSFVVFINLVQLVALHSPIDEKHQNIIERSKQPQKWNDLLNFIVMFVRFGVFLWTYAFVKIRIYTSYKWAEIHKSLNTIRLTKNRIYKQILTPANSPPPPPSGNKNGRIMNV